MLSVATAVVLCSSFTSLQSHTILFGSTTNSIYRRHNISNNSNVGDSSSNTSTTNKNNNINHNDDALRTLLYDKELFSIAPMMAHTNRHYHYYWRLFSKRTHLYTEMIPASQIVSAFYRELVRLGMSSSSSMDSHIINSEEILEVLYRIQQQPQREGNEMSRTNDHGNIESLYELLCSAEQNHSSSIKQEEEGGHHTTLQIGGKDPYLLAKAAAIGAAFGSQEGSSSSNKSTYSSINLNCGCPSNAVSGRSGGASLMKEPHHVAKCVESMNNGVTDIYQTQDNDKIRGITPISVKHRLGVRDASTYNVAEDKLKSDEEEAFPECSAFIKTIGQTGDVSKFQVHARLTLLGNFESDQDEEDNNQLWVPTATEMMETKAQSTPPQQQQQQPKVDHKRAQYKAKKKAREATLQNRSIPPLRPGVVDMLADEFPHLEFVANGGIQSMDAVRDRIRKRSSSSVNSIIGAMVGRSAINHPCSFSNADTLWQDNGGSNNIILPSRGEVLLKYIEYCDLEEERVRSMGVNINSLAALRRRLVAVPFHLFVGETGNTAYQRRIRKLASRIERYTAKGILMAALNEVPIESINKSVGEFNTANDLGDYGIMKRSGPLQKSIH